MKYYLKKPDTFEEIDIQAVNGELTISRRRKSHQVKIENLGNNHYAILVDNRSLVVEAEPSKKSVRVTIDHVEYDIPILNQRQKIESEIFGGSEAEDVSGEIRAPMPGLILRVEVEPGQPIEAGQPLLVMEAMKMENEIRAPENGTVSEVLVKSQQAVEKDDVLVKMSSL